MLLGFGVVNFLGALLAGWFMASSLRVTSIVRPALVGVVAFGIILPAVQGAGHKISIGLSDEY